MANSTEENSADAKSVTPETDVVVCAGLLRRIAAITYDAFLVVALWMISTLMLVSLTNEGKVIQGPLFQFFLWIETFAFYLLFWRLKGQTLGMQVWRIRTESLDGSVLSPW